MTNSKGALFGLDARISIAIFTVLSSMSGYLVFSKVEKARNTALIKELESIDTALRHTQNDLKTFLAFALNDSATPEEGFTVLWSSDVLKTGYQRYWNGPYYNKEHPYNERYGRYALKFQDEDNAPCSSSSKECHGYISLEGVPLSVWKMVNEYKDESLGQALEPIGNEHSQGVVRAESIIAPRTLLFQTVERPQRKVY